MAIYELNDEQLIPVAETSFAAENIYERKNIQQLLRAHIEVLDESLMVIAEEFGEWLDSSRRIDLLCIDTDANLVVVELKRTEDGGHMELQALRYAAMISAMTFEQLVETHARFRNSSHLDLDTARASILEFLGWSAPDEGEFGQDTRIILASANFSKELTTAVLWLIDRGIDIRCVRLKPYRLANGPVLLDIQQLIPLPETATFQTQIGVKRQAERKTRTERHELRYKFWAALLEYAKSKTPLHANRKPSQDNWIAGSIGRTGFSLSYVTRQTDSQVELWISTGKGQADRNMAAFQQLIRARESIEAAFGAALEWMDLPEGDGCRIRHVVDGGWRSPMDEWPEIHARLVDAMIRLNAAIRGPVLALAL
jgi:hypothetical protein